MGEENIKKNTLKIILPFVLLAALIISLIMNASVYTELNETNKKLDKYQTDGALSFNHVLFVKEYETQGEQARAKFEERFLRLMLEYENLSLNENVQEYINCAETKDFNTTTCQNIDKNLQKNLYEEMEDRYKDMKGNG